MRDLESVAVFFRISLNDAVKFTTDQEIGKRFAEWQQDARFTLGSAW